MPRAQGPTPSAGGQDSDLRTVASQVENLLDDDGHFNPNPDELSRGHPDYDESADPRARDRDEQGRFKKADSAAPGEIDDLETADPETDQLADDDVSDEDTDQQAAAGDTDEELADSAVDDDEDAESGITSLSQLAEALEMSNDDFLEALTDTFPAAGEEVTVTLADMRASFQKDADYRQSTAKLAEDRNRNEQEYATRMQEFDRVSHEQAAYFQAIEQALAQELESEDMARLRQSDPSEWVARREEIGKRLGFIQQTRDAARQRYDQVQTEYLQGVKDRSIAALQEAFPDFGAKHTDTAKQVMESLGYMPEEISKIFDHRLIKAALEMNELREKVAAFEAREAEAKEVTKRVTKTVPPLVKGGKGKPAGKAAIRKGALQRARANLSKEKTTAAAAQVIEHLI